MALEFVTAEQAATGHGVKILVYGGAGAGKTRLSATMPKPIIISAEAGLLTLNKMIKEGILDPQTPVIIIRSYQDLKDAFEWVRDNAAKHGIQSVALDSISEIAEQCLQAEKTKTKDPRQAYGEMAGHVLEKVKDFRDLSGLHVIVTAKETVGKDPVTGVEKAQPTAPGQQVGPALPYLFDEVFHAFTDKDGQGNTFHALRTQAAFNAVAKDRSGVLAEIEYPDAGYLIAKILAGPVLAEPTQPTT
jgi:hypothetical protein